MVVLGSGWAAISFVKALAKSDRHGLIIKPYFHCPTSPPPPLPTHLQPLPVVAPLAPVRRLPWTPCICWRVESRCKPAVIGDSGLMFKAFQS